MEGNELEVQLLRLRLSEQMEKPNDTKTKRRLGFLDLPWEIRHIIYGYVFKEGDTGSAKSDGSSMTITPNTWTRKEKIQVLQVMGMERFMLCEAIEPMKDSVLRLSKVQTPIRIDLIRKLMMLLEITPGRPNGSTWSGYSMDWSPLAQLTQLENFALAIYWRRDITKTSEVPNAESEEWCKEQWVIAFVKDILKNVRAEATLSWGFPPVAKKMGIPITFRKMLVDWDSESHCLLFLDAELLEKVANQYKHLRGKAPGQQYPGWRLVVEGRDIEGVEIEGREIEELMRRADEAISGGL